MGPVAGDDVSTLSGGQTKRVALAKVLVSEVDMLVLDEPTNHLDVEAIAWLEARLAAFRGGLVLVTHDRHVLDRVTTRILEIEGGGGYVHDGGYASYLANRSERAERDASTEAVRRNLAKSELAWLRRGAPARTRKPKARIAAATAIVEGGPAATRAAAPELAAASRGVTTPRLGDLVITLTGVGHRFGTAPGCSGTSTSTWSPAAAWASWGPTARARPRCWRSSRAGWRRPRARCGRRRRCGSATTARPAWSSTPPSGCGRPSPPPATQPNWEQARLMERFLFDNDIQQAPIATLSGGERRRLQLLLVLTRMPNVLLLDEPTNDLDLDTLRALEDHLETWPGSLVVVSHDRALLERTVEDVLVLDGRGGATMAPNGYAGYVSEQSGGQGGAGEPAEARPRRRPRPPARRPSLARPAPCAGSSASPSGPWPRPRPGATGWPPSWRPTTRPTTWPSPRPRRHWPRPRRIWARQKNAGWSSRKNWAPERPRRLSRQAADPRGRPSAPRTPRASWCRRRSAGGSTRSA